MLAIVKKNWKLVAIVSAVLVVAAIGVYVMRSKKQTKSEVKNGKIVLYSSSTCPHCINLKEDWEKFVGNAPVNGYDIHTIIDGDEEMLEKEKVQGFPTIKLYKGTGEVIEYSGNRTWESFMEFAKSN